MKLLWLCNMAPGVLQGGKQGGLWIDNVLSGLRQMENMCIRILFPADQCKEYILDDKCSCASFVEKLPYEYLPKLEAQFEEELCQYQPDAIHIWGTEYGHTLAMVNACQKQNLLERTAVSIQGLCSKIAQHYAEGIPDTVRNGYTFRDFIRRDNIVRQQKKFVLRGELEVQALRKVHHIIGRTDWDEACTKQINSKAAYHFCNETLRSPFYDGNWEYTSCKKHRIFASSCVYPIKGFHYLLQALAEVRKTYPDATLAVPGNSFVAEDLKGKLRQSSYQKYMLNIARKYHLENHIEFLGHLGPQQMKENYLQANVFVLPSTIENSPNSLGEAMLLGVPCVASLSGGVATMMEHNKEGFVYQSTAPYMLAHYINRIFSMEENAEKLGIAAKHHAQKTHDAQMNLKQLIEIYKELSNQT